MGAVFVGIMLLIPRMVLATPAVSSVSGFSDANGDSLTITCTGAGTKSTVAPLIFDTFESGSMNGAWANTTGLSVNSDNARNAFSTKNVHHDFKDGTSNDIHNAYFTAASTVYPKWYVSYWFKIASNWDWGTSDFSGTNKFLANIKIFRLWNPGSTSENFVMATEGYTGAPKTIQYGTENVSSFIHTMSNFETTISKNAWHHMQMSYAENSGLGVSDGVFKLYFDGVLISSTAALNTKNSAANTTDGVGNKRPFIIGWYNSWGDSEGTPDTTGDDAPNDYYMDDVYMDHFWARAEIGNASTYAACTVREEQTLTAWADTSVSVTYKKGDLTGTKYLYLVDDSGNVSPGFSLSAGGDVTNPTVSITAPAEGATVSGAAVSVTASASDNVGVSGVQFKVDGSNQGAEDTSAPYAITWDTTGLTNASHTLSAVARDAAGNIATATIVNVTVSNVTTATSAGKLTISGAGNIRGRGTYK